MAARKRRITPKVNLLKKQQRVLRIQSKRLELISSLSLFILIFYCVGFVSTLFYLGYLKGNLMLVERKLEEEKTNMKLVESVREDYFLLKNRSTAIKGISDSVSRHQAIIEKILALFPDGVSINGMSITEDGVVEFSVKASSIEDVESLFDVIKKEKNANGLITEYALVNSLSVSEAGDYSFGMFLAIKAEAEKE